MLDKIKKIQTGEDKRNKVRSLSERERERRGGKIKEFFFFLKKEGIKKSMLTGDLIPTNRAIIINEPNTIDI